MPRTLATMDLDASRAALDFVHRLLARSSSDQPDLAGVLAELASAFAVSACGLCVLPDGKQEYRHPAPANPGPAWPWLDDPSVLNQDTLSAVQLERLDKPSLLATVIHGPVGTMWVLYLEDDREFSDSERAALALTGQVLARCLPQDGLAPWSAQIDRAARQHQMETAAGVTRRLAHDFGNVLTGILGFTELAMSQQIPANTPLHSYLNEVYRAAQSGAQFTHQLRLFSRRQSATSRSAALPAVLAELEAKLFADRDSGVNFRLSAPSELPPVALDPEHLTGVLTALLSNAREALLGPGSISVSARAIQIELGNCREVFGNVRPGAHVEIIIADTGIGLNPEVQRKLFSEPFFTTKPRRRGFGLATAYGILHAHKGGIRLHPGAEGGVVARVLLPVAPASSVTTSDQIVRPSEKSRGERILLVDDDQEVLKLVGTTLMQAGYRIDPHSGGQSALDAYATAGSDPYHLVLSDVLMPGVNGVELVKRLQKRDPSVKVLFLSAHVSPDFMQHDFAGDGYELLSKPFRTEQLLRAVRSALDRPARRIGSKR